MDAKRKALEPDPSADVDAVFDAELGEKLEDGSLVVDAQREDGTPLSDREGPSRPAT